MQYVAVLQAERSLQLLVIDPGTGNGFFIRKNILAVVFLEAGMQGRYRWVIQNARDLHWVGTERHFRRDDRDGRGRHGLAILPQTLQVGIR